MSCKAQVAQQIAAGLDCRPFLVVEYSPWTKPRDPSSFEESIAHNQNHATLVALHFLYVDLNAFPEVQPQVQVDKKVDKKSLVFLPSQVARSLCQSTGPNIEETFFIFSTSSLFISPSFIKLQ